MGAYQLNVKRLLLHKLYIGGCPDTASRLAVRTADRVQVKDPVVGTVLTEKGLPEVLHLRHFEVECTVLSRNLVQWTVSYDWSIHLPIDLVSCTAQAPPK
jgi:hypothetical protein